MSKILPVTPLRAGVTRSSHLRNVSNGSSTAPIQQPPSRVSTPGAASSNCTVIRDVYERRCSLSVHDELHEREEILINLDLFAEHIKPGDLVAIIALKTDSGVRDFQAKSAPLKKDGENLGPPMQRERSGSNPKAPSDSMSDSQYDVDSEKRYFFIVKDMTKEQKAKQPHTEISIVKHAADAFGFKNRSTVLLTTVSITEVNNGKWTNLSK